MESISIPMHIILDTKLKAPEKLMIGIISYLAKDNICTENNGEIAKYMCMTPGATSTIINGLVEAGYLGSLVYGNNKRKLWLVKD